MTIYIIINKTTGRKTAIGGACTSWMECAKRAGLEPAEWYLVSKEYID